MNWLVLRLTGLLLAVLVIGHFALTHFVTDVAETDSAFVAAQWTSLWVIVWDWLMLTSAVAHGAAGMWLVTGEYATGRPRRFFRGLMLVVAALMLIVGAVTMLSIQLS